MATSSPQSRPEQTGTLDPYRATTFDLLLIDGDRERARATIRTIESTMPMRHHHSPNGRDAIEFFRVSRCDAIVCRPHLGDIGFQHWIRMIRQGPFGFQLTPAIVLCDGIERQNLSPMIDEQTSLVDEREPEGLLAALNDVARGTHKHSVLVIEDDPMSARAAEKALEKYYRVEMTQDGAEGLRLWQERHHDIMLLDLMLPGIPGDEILRSVIRERADQVVIVVTANASPERHQELVLAGASDFVAKGADTHDLPQICAAALRAKQCLTNVEQARAEASTMLEVATRVRAADYHYERGQTAYGKAHLKRALASARAHMPDEDYWASIQAEIRAP